MAHTWRSPRSRGRAQPGRDHLLVRVTTWSVARAARLLGTTAVVVMPDDAPVIKRERVAGDGAEIVIVGPASDERQARAEFDRGRARSGDHPAVR